MEFKFPRQILIGDTMFKIIYDKGRVDAEFSYPKEGEEAFIILGTKSLESNPLTFLNCIIHELKEIVHIEQATAYRRMDSGDYVYMYSHQHHAELCARLAGLLSLFIK